MYKFTLAIISILLCACNRPAPSQNDELSESHLKDDVTALLNQYHRGMLEKNTDELLSTIAEDGLVVGTDPDEFWSKKEISDYLTQAFSDSTQFKPYTVVREVRPGPDEKSALVIEQYVFQAISGVIPVRGIAYVVKENGQWKIDTYSVSLIPQNEELSKINAYLGAAAY